jgi:hypothetical protein
MQPKAIVDVFAVDVTQKIFIGRNAQSRRTAAPLDLKCTIRVDFRKCGDCSLVSRDLPIASDSDPMAAG